MTTIAPNRSLIVGEVTARAAGSITLRVESTRAVWDGVQDLAAGKETLAVAIVDGSPPPVVGARVEVECSLEPMPEGGIAFVAYSIGTCSDQR
jgi:hypothetical protein